MYLNVVFFNQKTAYEMRISDWSSDVCSSDLCVQGATEDISCAADAGNAAEPNGAEALDDGVIGFHRSHDLADGDVRWVLDETHPARSTAHSLDQIGRAHV